MYSDRIVAVVKVNGQVLRENGDTVTIPFGSEFSLLVKNLNSVRAQIKVSVDGADATEGTRLIIPANSSVELERFIRNGNLQAGNRFKFIERSVAVEAHRGIGVDDGLIRVEAWREHVTEYVNVPVPVPYPYDWPNRWPYPRPWGRWPYPRPWGPYYGGGTYGVATYTSSSNQMRSFSSIEEQTRGDAGITVAGSESHQQFSMAGGFPVEATSTVIVLRLRGEVAGQPVAAAVTVDMKPICTTCGKTNKATMKFCGECGTSLCAV